MPWGHFGVSYLLYSAYSRRRYGNSPEAMPALLVALGSQFPDLVDKPLAWELNVLPGGRTLAHSLITTIALLSVLYALTAAYGRTRLVTAFAIGHVSHLFADVPPVALMGDPMSASFLLWPVLAQLSYDPYASSEAIFWAYQWLQVVAFVGALLAWYRDEAPGTGFLSW